MLANISFLPKNPAKRRHFISLINTTAPTLEIGPFFSPMVRGDTVYYFDVLDQSALIERAKSMKLGEVKPPFIHFVSPNGDLAIIDRKFENAVSSHSIEHQPDLASHLQNVGNVLVEGGRYYVIAPDKRYCFDHYLPDSTFGDVLCAYAERRTNHTLVSAIKNHSLRTHNDPKRHWRGDHEDPGHGDGIGERAAKAVEDFRATEGYVDLHAWQFTPATFQSICQRLYDLKLSPLRPVRVYQTPRGRQEFTAILEKPA